MLSFDLAYGTAEVRAGLSVGGGQENLEVMKAAPKTLAGLPGWVKDAIAAGQA